MNPLRRPRMDARAEAAPNHSALLFYALLLIPALAATQCGG